MLVKISQNISRWIGLDNLDLSS